MLLGFHWSRLSLAVAVIALGAGPVQGANGIWTGGSGGSWANSTNWSNGIIAGGSGGTADFSRLILASSPTLTLDGSRAIGNLIFGDAGNGFGWNLDAGSGGPLTLAISSGYPTITVNNLTTSLGLGLAGVEGMSKAGAGTLTLTSDNTYTGGSFVNAGSLNLAGGNNGNSRVGSSLLTVNVSGTLTAGADNPLGWGDSRTPSLAVNGGNVSAGAYYFQFMNLTMNGGSLLRTANSWFSYGDFTINSNASGATISGGNLILRNSSHNTIFDVAAGASAVDLTISSVLAADGGTDSADSKTGFMGVVKSGSGVLNLSGAETYIGATTIQAGTLQIRGSLASTNVTVDSGAVLSGAGFAGQSVIISNGATLCVTNNLPLSMGSLNLGALNSDNVTVVCNGNGTALAGFLVVTNFKGLAINGAVSLNLTGTLPAVAPGCWNLITYSGPVQGSGMISAGVLPSGIEGYITNNNALAAIQLVVTNVSAAPPFITGPPQSISCYAGHPAAFAVTAEGSTPVSFQWQQAGASLISATNSTLAIPATAFSNAGPYEVIVANAYGSVTSAPVVLTVIPAPAPVTLAWGVPTLDQLAAGWMTVSELRNNPSVNNFSGGLKVDSENLLGITLLSFPPYIQGYSTTGDLWLNGQPVDATESQWFPYQVLRQTTVGNIHLQTAVRMTFQQSGVLFQTQLTNTGTQTAIIDLSAALTGCVRYYGGIWGWSPPRPDTNGFQASLTNSGQVLVVADTQSPACCAFAFATPPTDLSICTSGDQGVAAWSLSLPPGQSQTVDFVLAVADDASDATARATAWATAFDPTFDQAKTLWEQRWSDVFSPTNGYFSGHAPVLRTQNETIQHIYYSSILASLVLERTNLPEETRAWPSAGPEWAVTDEYFWDTSLWSSFFTLLDPAMVKAHLQNFLTLNYHNCYAQDFLSSGPTGPWYSANDLSLFSILWNYIAISGDWGFLKNSVTNDSLVINGTTGSHTILEHMDYLASYWKSLVPAGASLADYGGNENLLECTPAYINQVASLNAGDVWMMRRMAEIHDRLGESATASNYLAEAAIQATNVLQLYVSGDGVWDCRHDDGTVYATRHVYDYVTVGQSMTPDLTPTMQSEMSAFVERELIVPGWMRALSLSDPYASESDRPDHGPLGAYDGWPAMTALTMCRFGQYNLALDLLTNCEGVLNEGTFSQSHELLPNSCKVGMVVPDHPALNPTEALTVEAWINAQAWQSNEWQGSIVSKDRWDAGNAGYVLRCGQGGQLSFTLAIDGDFPEALSAPVMPTNQWCFVAGTFDGENLKVYINGVLQAAVEAPGSIITSVGDLNIGRGLLDPTRTFIGTIDDVRLYNRALSAIEITNQFPLGGNYASNDTNGLALALSLDENSGSDSVDAVGGPPAVFVAAPAWVPGREGSGIFIPPPGTKVNDVYERIAHRGDQDYNAGVGSAFASQTILRGLFGVEPDTNSALLPLDAGTPRGFTGSLAGFTYQGASYRITSNANGLSVGPDVATAPCITNYVLLPGGYFSLSGNMAPSQPCILLTATNLTSVAVWSPVETNTADPNGKFSFMDPQPVVDLNRYYRVYAP